MRFNNEAGALSGNKAQRDHYEGMTSEEIDAAMATDWGIAKNSFYGDLRDCQKPEDLLDFATQAGNGVQGRARGERQPWMFSMTSTMADENYAQARGHVYKGEGFHPDFTEIGRLPDMLRGDLSDVLAILQKDKDIERPIAEKIVQRFESETYSRETADKETVVQVTVVDERYKEWLTRFLDENFEQKVNEIISDDMPGPDKRKVMARVLEDLIGKLRQKRS